MVGACDCRYGEGALKDCLQPGNNDHAARLLPSRAMQLTDGQIRDAITGLLQERQPLATICPSEAARALASTGWRPLMPRVREVAITMAREGLLEIRQGGRTVSPGQPMRGPIRLGRPSPT